MCVCIVDPEINPNDSDQSKMQHESKVSSLRNTIFPNNVGFRAPFS